MRLSISIISRAFDNRGVVLVDDMFFGHQVLDFSRSPGHAQIFGNSFAAG